jgi:hypothetical protein
VFDVSVAQVDPALDVASMTPLAPTAHPWLGSGNETAFNCTLVALVWSTQEPPAADTNVGRARKDAITGMHTTLSPIPLRTTDLQDILQL